MGARVYKDEMEVETGMLQECLVPICCNKPRTGCPQRYEEFVFCIPSLRFQIVNVFK